MKRARRQGNPMQQETQSSQQTQTRGEWNHHPELPISTAPYFDWPSRPLRIAKWLARLWLPVTERGLVLALSILTWLYLTPSLERARVFALDWVAEIFVRNMALMIIVAGGLHLYLYTFRGQGKALKYDHRDLADNNRTFTFNSQVRDNMFWSLGSCVPVWTAYEALLLWGFANGYGFLTEWSDNPVWFAALFLLSPFWVAFSFYWIHRLLHWPPLYRLAHAVHHRNSNVGPWSGCSMHPVEHVLWLSSVMVHLIIASHPVHVIFYQQIQILTAITSHSGYEGLLIGEKNRLYMGEFFHQLHHRYHECNYGSSETPWDELFGTFHNGSPEATKAMRERRRMMHARS
ncbi:MAG: sterol desaturase family protein [Pseudomonadota bacterium]